MNKLNGGYVMLKYDASQEKLKDAYESSKPVIVYDASNRGLWAKITESSGTYSIEPLVSISDVPASKKLYEHFLCLTFGNQESIKLVIYNDNNDSFTEEKLKAFLVARNIEHSTSETSYIAYPCIGRYDSTTYYQGLYVYNDSLYGLRCNNVSTQITTPTIADTITEVI